MLNCENYRVGKFNPYCDRNTLDLSPIGPVCQPGTTSKAYVLQISPSLWRDFESGTGGLVDVVDLGRQTYSLGEQDPGSIDYFG